jgi:hypothetical protein
MEFLQDLGISVHWPTFAAAAFTFVIGLFSKTPKNPFTKK